MKIAPGTGKPNAIANEGRRASLTPKPRDGALRYDFHHDTNGSVLEGQETNHWDDHDSAGNNTHQPNDDGQRSIRIQQQYMPDEDR